MEGKISINWIRRGLELGAVGGGWGCGPSSVQGCVVIFEAGDIWRWSDVVMEGVRETSYPE